MANGTRSRSDYLEGTGSWRFRHPMTVAEDLTKTMTGVVGRKLTITDTPQQLTLNTSTERFWLMAPSSSESITVPGINTDVDSGVAEVVWKYGGLYTFLTTAQTVNVVSSDAADAAAGTGARTVLITGLDSSWDVLTETVTLNGTTPVTTSSTFWRINSVVVVTAGSGAANAGNVTLTSSSSSTVMAYIAIGDNRSVQWVYSVPRNHQVSFSMIHTSVSESTGNASITFSFWVRPFGGVFLRSDSWANHATRNPWITISSPAQLTIDGRSDMYLLVSSDTNNVTANASGYGELHCSDEMEIAVGADNTVSLSGTNIFMLPESTPVGPFTVAKGSSSTGLWIVTASTDRLLYVLEELA